MLISSLVLYSCCNYIMFLHKLSFALVTSKKTNFHNWACGEGRTVNREVLNTSASKQAWAPSSSLREQVHHISCLFTMNKFPQELLIKTPFMRTSKNGQACPGEEESSISPPRYAASNLSLLMATMQISCQRKKDEIEQNGEESKEMRKLLGR